MAQKIATTVLSRSASPDMFQAERNYVRLAAGGRLVNVDDLWSEEMWSHYPAWVRDDIEVNGSYYAVPQLGQQWGFYYRPSLLEEAGLTPPTTKDELVEAAQALTTDDVYGFAFGAGDNFTAYESFLSILYMMDGRLVHDGEPRVDTEEARTALQFLHDLIYEYEVVPPSAPQLKESEVGDLFVGGQVAMMGQWDYHFARATNPEQSNVVDDVAFTTPPSWDEATDGKAPGDFQILAINAYSENIGAAKLFLDYMRSQQAHANELLLEGNDTLVRDVYDMAAAETELEPGYLQAHSDLVDASLRENYTQMAEVIDVFGGQIQSALAQAKTVEQALADAQSAIDEIMSSN
ncbi:MAG: extracellular solute-binding protein [Trueperaceae bacterium]|nr:extracellular solute-binding protein [Trueperaceae bacterium]